MYYAVIPAKAGIQKRLVLFEFPIKHSGITDEEFFSTLLVLIQLHYVFV